MEFARRERSKESVDLILENLLVVIGEEVRETWFRFEAGKNTDEEEAAQLVQGSSTLRGEVGSTGR